MLSFRCLVYRLLPFGCRSIEIPREHAGKEYFAACPGIEGDIDEISATVGGVGVLHLQQRDEGGDADQDQHDHGDQYWTPRPALMNQAEMVAEKAMGISWMAMMMRLAD